MLAEFYMEIGCEEIPARVMARSLEELGNRIANFFTEQKLHFDRVDTLGTARRFIVHVPALAESQEPRKELTLGPPARIAYQDGVPSPALAGFAKRNNRAVEELRTFQTEKGDYVGFETTIEGRSVFDLLAAGIPQIVHEMTFPKMMIWTDRERKFARPVRWIVARYGEHPLDLTLFGVRSGDTSEGHRILSTSGVHAGSYAEFTANLRKNYVIASPEERQRKIEEELHTAATAAGGHPVTDDRLMEEVVFINEYPTVLTGSFDTKFLALPEEILITVMKEHQKYFALRESPGGPLLPHFLAVINAARDARGLIRKGHERVLRARLSDAMFFWEVDHRQTLEQRREQLSRIVFQDKLGSYGDKVKRLVRLAAKVNALTRSRVPAATLKTAVEWSKSDLTTGMVREFTDLQGVVGGLYARREGAPEEIAAAIYDQYRPLSLEDRTPSTKTGRVLSIADRLDTVCGCFSVGLIPSGSADPLGLRRQIQGVMKILIDHDLPFSIRKAAERAAKLTDERQKEFETFCAERLRYILGQMGFAYDELNAVLTVGSDNPADVLARVKAVHEARSSEDFRAIAAAFKRIKNILRQADKDGAAEVVAIEPDGMEAEELALFEFVRTTEPAVAKYCRRGKYGRALEATAAGRPSVDRFFDKIMVMHEDRGVRLRRLSLLRRLAGVFLAVADVSEVVAAQSA